MQRKGSPVGLCALGDLEHGHQPEDTVICSSFCGTTWASPPGHGHGRLEMTARLQPLLLFLSIILGYFVTRLSHPGMRSREAGGDFYLSIPYDSWPAWGCSQSVGEIWQEVGVNGFHHVQEREALRERVPSLTMCPVLPRQGLTLSSFSVGATCD